VDKLKETLHRVNVTGQLALHGVNTSHLSLRRWLSESTPFVPTASSRSCSRTTASGLLRLRVAR
jgi:hypothetical protein